MRYLDSEFKKIYASKKGRKIYAPTFGYFDALDGFVVHGSGAFFDKLVALYAKVDYFRPFNYLLEKLYQDIVNDFCCSLLMIRSGGTSDILLPHLILGEISFKG